MLKLPANPERRVELCSTIDEKALLILRKQPDFVGAEHGLPSAQ
jgi:hypothetical protein